MNSTWSRRDLFTFGQSGPPSPTRLVHIASALVQLVPDAREAVRQVVSTLPGAELHETGHDTKLAVVLESADERAIGRAVDELSQVRGVLSVSIVAHLSELEAALDEELDDESSAISPA